MRCVARTARVQVLARALGYPMRFLGLATGAALLALVGCVVTDAQTPAPKPVAAEGPASEPPCNPAREGLAPLNHEGHGDLAVPLPAEYHERVNPCPLTPEVVARGKKIFDDHCAKCHGAGGDPTTAPLKDLTPPAKKLTVGGFSAAYLFWRASEGGAMEPFRSQMPAFKTVLREDEIWMVGNYVIGLRGTDIVPLSPTIQSVEPLPAGDGGASPGLRVFWRLASECQSLKLERKKDAAAYALAYTLTGFVTEHEDFAVATAPGRYCYRVTCEGVGRVSAPSNEMCNPL